MIYFDVTKTAAVRHRSGLARLSARLRDELGEAASAGSWQECSARATADDWFVTSELFSESERPGFTEFLEARRCRTAAIFADAIPLKHPHITWPQSVARHPHYLKLLARFDRVWAISQGSRDELCDYWRWLGLERKPPVEVLPLGADLAGTPRVVAPWPAPRARALLCVGILEPRKNQLLLLNAAEALWHEGLDFDLHVVGRVNPHFGAPIVARVKALRQAGRAVHHHAAASDAALSQLFATVRATVFPTMAEGCGLPLLESLWQGVPCVCSDLPVLRENADGGGCWLVPTGDPIAWVDALRMILTDDARCLQLATEARQRPLPTWRAAAERLRGGLK
ncbi:glycosyltransferase [Opitutus terrae]|uniref:Glycosyl transferase group 1 n=1 Tax=Opitutus terrae (strain DSM 11246 / JCM 15787 / PB90-1) TaxID=452637 RepID=B1ZZU9_OPITP|nr:glycosyltransferase [Opitutus terrae]ACB77285.1 glycosyl transferase group 1 [Opitutus terrae PB90-1]